MGLSGESHHVGEDGSYVYIDDDDEGVYIHEGRITEGEIRNNQFQNPAPQGEIDYSAGGTKMGEGVTIEEARHPQVEQHSFGGTLAALGGFTFSIGVSKDGYGNYMPFLTTGIALGVDASVGYQYTVLTTNTSESLTVHDVQGGQVDYEVGIGNVDISLWTGGDTGDRWDAGAKGQGKRYRSNSIGLSLGLPLGYTYQSTYTNNLRKRRKTNP